MMFQPHNETGILWKLENMVKTVAFLKPNGKIRNIAINDELAVDIVYCNDFQLVESGPGIRPFSAAIFATTAHRLVHFRQLRHLWIV